MADLFDVVVARKLSGGGGGGSSDFSTAEVTFVNQTESFIYDFLMPCVEGTDTEYVIPNAAGALVDLDASNTKTYTAILYKGICSLSYPSNTSMTFSITGSAEKISDGVVSVTGDCTITIS